MQNIIFLTEQQKSGLFALKMLKPFNVLMDPKLLFPVASAAWVDVNKSC